MNPSIPKPLARWLLASSEQLGGMLSHVRLLRRLTAVLRDNLPAPLAEHCVAANIDGTTLVVAASSSVWAAKLRYHLPTLLTQLQLCDVLPTIDNIRIRIQPLQLERDISPVIRPPLSANTVALITQVADHTIDSALREALHRLARHASDKNSKPK